VDLDGGDEMGEWGMKCSNVLEINCLLERGIASGDRFLRWVRYCKKKDQAKNQTRCNIERKYATCRRKVMQ
jgi:hypothetical protein